MVRGVHGQGMVVEGVKGVEYIPQLPEIYKNGEKQAYKSPKMLFFAQKYLPRYTPETFLRKTSILYFFIT